MERTTLVDRVYAVLREKILLGEYSSDRNFNIDFIARDLGVSNTPVREAMSRLERAGLVEIIPYSGPRIRKLSITQLKDLYTVRIALEELALKLVIRRNDPTAFKMIEQALVDHKRIIETGDTRQILSADHKFHHTLVLASGNSALLEMLPGLSDRTQMLMEINRPPTEALTEEDITSGYDGHKLIYELMLAGNTERAVAELHTRLVQGKTRLISRMKARENV